jgi:hypothetical protein
LARSEEEEVPVKPIDYTSRFDEALSKAFASRSPDVRAAYFDLASFYHRKMPKVMHPQA